MKKADLTLVERERVAFALALSRCRAGHRTELGKLAEVLSGGGEDELITCAVRSPKSQSIEPEDAFEVSEQHLDLLAKPA